MFGGNGFFWCKACLTRRSMFPGHQVLETILECLTGIPASGTFPVLFMTSIGDVVDTVRANSTLALAEGCRMRCHSGHIGPNNVRVGRWLGPG